MKINSNDLSEEVEGEEVIEISTHDTEITSACNALFYPQLFKIAQNNFQTSYTLNPRIFSEPEDYYDDVACMERESSTPLIEEMLSLDDAIVRSLQASPNEDLRSRLVQNILLIGGGCEISDLAN